MSAYRLFLLDSVDHITGPHTDIECVDDASALAVAAGRIGSASAIEVWCGARLVGMMLSAAGRLL